MRRIEDISLCGELRIKTITTPITQIETKTLFTPIKTALPGTKLIVKTLTNETSYEAESVSMTKTEEVGPPIPGFISLPALFGLIIMALMHRRRRM